MSAPIRCSPAYSSLPSDDVENGDSIELPSERGQKPGVKLWLAGVAAIAVALVAAGLFLCPEWRTTISKPVFNPQAFPCTEPALRREWRQLARSEQASYIEAVKCLNKLPSKMHPHGRLTDDFPWSHRLIEHYAHDAAPFLPWHRYFIHVYEMALRQECGYTGHLAYWDWTLDWKDPAQSPIWDPENGFGGDGDVNGNETVFSGRCVRNGPFAEYTVYYSNNTINPHCLSRGFGCMDSGQFDGTWFSPRLVERLQNKTTYLDFLLDLEMSSHNAMPNGVCGDFFSFDAPADPVFYLHHVQLDRLWWLWQQEQPSRTMEYNGRSSGHSQVQASLNDTLPMHGLAREPRVEEVMDTQGGLLCYRY